MERKLRAFGDCRENQAETDEFEQGRRFATTTFEPCQALSVEETKCRFDPPKTQCRRAHSRQSIKKKQNRSEKSEVSDSPNDKRHRARPRGLTLFEIERGK